MVLRSKNLFWKIKEIKNVLANNVINIPGDSLINLKANDQNFYDRKNIEEALVDFLMQC